MNSHRLWSIVSAFILCSFISEATEAPCANMVSLMDDTIDEAFHAEQESHTLFDLVNPNPAKNLAVQHPLIVMNAFQKAVALIEYIPSYEIRDPDYGGTDIKIYPVFSGGTDFTGGKQIVEQYAPINAVVNYIKAGARGDGAAVKMPLLTGPSGTGKSEFLSLIGILLTKLSSENPDFFQYTFRWKNLKDITNLRPFIEIPLDKEGNEIDIPRTDSLNRSPFTLLPPKIQDNVLFLARQRAIQLGQNAPDPIRVPDPHSIEIRRIILQHYAKRDNKTDLTGSDIVKYLAPHVEIVRRNFNGVNSFTKIGAQGRDIPWNELFASPNPFVMTLYGPRNVFSHHLTGSFFDADGNWLILDEYFRNPDAFRDLTLDIIESRLFKRGGAPSIIMDMVILGASNDPSIAKAIADGNAAAHIDRTRRLPARYSINPWGIAKTMLLMKGEKNLLERRLNKSMLKNEMSTLEKPEATLETIEATNEWKPGKLNDLYPLPEGDNGYKTHEGEYALAVKMEEGTEPIFIAPHALQFMSYVIASTRLVTDQRLASEFGQYGIIKGPDFSSIINRLKIITGEIQIEENERGELVELKNYLKEGDKGISQRDASHAWLKEAIDEARKPENDNTLSTTIVAEVFVRLLSEGGITYPDEPTRKLWLNNMVAIAQEFVIPWHTDDLNTAMNSGQDSTNAIYDEVKAEYIAISKNRDARTYAIAGRKSRNIQFDRQKEIEKYYPRGKIDALEIMAFHTRNSDPNARYRPLMQAITRMLAVANGKVHSWSGLTEFGRSRQGDAETAGKYTQLSQIMIHSLGYSGIL